MAGRPSTKQAPIFGTHLSTLRKAHGFTQSQLAKLLGIPVDMLTYYERRAKNPTAEFIAKAAKVLNVSADELLGHSIKTGKNTRPSGPPSQLEQRLKSLRQLPREKQKVLVQVLDTFLRDAQHTSKHNLLD